MPRRAAISTWPGFDISGAARGDREDRAGGRGRARAPACRWSIFQNGWDADYVEAGGPGSPNWHKSNALKTMRERPELQGKLLAKGGWDYALVDGAGAAAGRHRRRRSRATRPSSTPARQRAARPRHPQPGLHRHRHQRLRRIDFARRLLPRIFRRGAARTRPTMPAPTSSRRRRSTMSRNSSAGSPSIADFCGAFGQTAIPMLTQASERT